MNESQPPTQGSPVPLEYRGRPEAAETNHHSWTEVTFFICGLLAIIFATWWLIAPKFSSACVATLQSNCSSNLKNIAAGMITYSNTHNGAYPTSLGEELVETQMPSQIFVCPASNDMPATGTPQQQAASFSTPGTCSYIYLGKGLNSNASEDTVIAYEPLSNHKTGINVAFNDFHVQWLNATDAQKLINSIVPGKPVYWPLRGGK
jgi:hypothetical protein